MVLLFPGTTTLFILAAKPRVKPHLALSGCTHSIHVLRVKRNLTLRVGALHLNPGCFDEKGIGTIDYTT